MPSIRTYNPDAISPAQRRFDDRVASLDAIAVALSGAGNLDELLERALSAVIDVTAVDMGGIFLVDEHTGDVRLAASHGLSEAVVDSFRRNPGDRVRRFLAGPASATIVSDLLGGGDGPLPRKEVLDAGINAYCAIPLHAGDQTYGVMMACSVVDSDFGNSDVQMLVTMGQQIGLAIGVARLTERERRRAQQLETIHEVGRRLGAYHTERELLPRIVGFVRDHLGYESANLLLLNDEAQELRLVAAIGLGNEHLTGNPIPLDEERSICGWVVRHNEPLLANDITSEPRHFPGSGREQAELAVPIAIGERVLGVLDVQSSHTNAFHELDVSVLQILAGQLAVAIEHARQFDDARRALRRLRAFQDLATAFTSSLDIRTILERTLDVAMDVFQADRAGLYMIVPGKRSMWVGASRNLSPEYLAAVQRYYDTEEWLEDLDEAPSLYVEDAQTRHVTPELTEAVRSEGFRSMLYLPLPNGPDRLGTFVLYHNQIRRYSDADIRLARTFAEQANIALQHARLFEAERRAREHTTAILDATRAVTSSLQLEDVLREAGRALAHTLRQPLCSIWMLSDDHSRFLPAYRIGRSANAKLDDIFRNLPAVPVRSALRFEKMLRDHAPFVVDRLDGLTEAEQAIYQVLAFEKYMAVPLVARDRVIGAAVVPIFDRSFTIEPADLDVALAIARSTALALENARLYEQSQQLAVSEERNRLARELHDSVTHALFSMTMIGQALPRLIDRDLERARERVERLNELGKGALAEMRALIFQLRPAALQDQGLVTALSHLAAAFESREEVRVDLKLDIARRLPLPLEEALFRIAQEALNNVAKHARASNVSLTLTMTGPQVELCIQDDGLGFDLHLPLEAGRSSLGLISMRERAELAGGVLVITSGPGMGTNVLVRAPI